MNGLWQAIRRSVGRIADAGLLNQGWTADTATDWIWARVQPSAFAHLIYELGWTQEEYTERTVTGLLRDTVADG